MSPKIMAITMARAGSVVDPANIFLTSCLINKERLVAVSDGDLKKIADKGPFPLR